MSAVNGKTRERVTQRDIAKAVGVSHVTVSHVLHRPHEARVSPETAREILRMAQEMSYEPRSVTTRNICIVVEPDSLWADVTTNVLTAADEILRAKGCRMTVSTLGKDTIATASQLFNQKTVDGIIFTEWYDEDSECLHALRVPWILLADTTDLDSRVDQIALDTVNTTHQMTNYLLERGHRQICVVTGRAGIGIHDRLVQGVKNAVNAWGLPESCVRAIHDDDSIELESLLLTELNSHNPSTALLAGGPGSALVTLNRLQRNGYGVPDDVSLISLIDSPRLEALRPRISATTAVGAQTVEMVIERLLNRIKNGNIDPQRQFVSGDIVERDSVASINS